MRRLLRLSRVVDRISRAAGTVATWLTLAMVLLGAANALARTSDRELGTRIASNAFTELCWYFFAAVFLLGAAHTLRTDRHVRVDALYGGHGPRGKAWIDLVGGVLFLVPFCVAAIWFSWSFVVHSWEVGEVSSDHGGLLRYPIKTLIPVAFALLALQGLSEIVKRVAFLRGLPAEECGLLQEQASGSSGDGA